MDNKAARVIEKTARKRPHGCAKYLLDQWTAKLGYRDIALDLLDATGWDTRYCPQFLEAWYDSPCDQPDHQEPGVLRYYKDFYGEEGEHVPSMVLDGSDIEIVRGNRRVYIFRKWLTEQEEDEIIKIGTAAINGARALKRFKDSSLWLAEAAVKGVKNA